MYGTISGKLCLSEATVVDLKAQNRACVTLLKNLAELEPWAPGLQTCVTGCSVSQGRMWTRKDHRKKSLLYLQVSACTLHGCETVAGLQFVVMCHLLH